jgi:hypothetical protein
MNLGKSNRAGHFRCARPSCQSRRRRNRIS